MLLWTWVYKYLFKTLLSILWAYTQKWNCCITWGSGFTFWKNCHISHSGWTILSIHSHPQCTGFQFLHILINTLPRLLSQHEVASPGTLITDPWSLHLYLPPRTPGMLHSSTLGYLWASVVSRFFRSFRAEQDLPWGSASVNPWFIGLSFAEILFFKHLIVSGTQKSGRAMKTAWGFQSRRCPG